MADEKKKSGPRDTRGLPDRTGPQARYDRYLSPRHSMGPNLDLQRDFQDSPMPTDNVQKKSGPPVKKSLGPTQMRAPSTMERVGQGIRDVLGSVAEQPLARISDALGITGLNQLSQADPRNNEMQRGEMVGDPRGILRNFSKPGSIAPMRQGLPAEFNQTVPNSRTAPIDMNNLPSGKMEMMTDFPSNISGEAYALEEALLRKQRQGLK